MRRFAWLPLLLAAAVTLAQADFSAGMNAYRKGDYATAMANWRPLAEAGSPQAQFNVGLLHAKGLGVETDWGEAARWYELAAQQDFAQAQYNLAELYEAGRGVPTDLTISYVWFKLAGTHKYADARKRRKAVAKRMTPYELAQADLMAREWLRKRKTEE